MVVVDGMLFSGESVSVGTSWPVSLMVGAGLILPCMLTQKYAYGDRWLIAFGKSLLVGIITAIPTALPAIMTVLLTVLGYSGTTAPNRPQEISESNEE